MNDLGKPLVITGIVLVIAARAKKEGGRLTSFLGAVMWTTGGLGGLGHLPGDSRRAGVLAQILSCAFDFGTILEGELFRSAPRPGDFCKDHALPGSPHHRLALRCRL